MGIFLVVALYIWIGNKIEMRSLHKKWSDIDQMLNKEASDYILQKAEHELTFKSMNANSNWRNWFIKGYIIGAKDGNGYFNPMGKSKLHKESSYEEWEQYEESKFSHIKDDSDYFGGNKKNALFCYIIGHEAGVLRYEEQGPPK